MENMDARQVITITTYRRRVIHRYRVNSAQSTMSKYYFPIIEKIRFYIQLPIDMNVQRTRTVEYSIRYCKSCIINPEERERESTDT